MPQSKRLYIVWNAYHKVVQRHYRTWYPFLEHFLKWNRWLIKGRDIIEYKMFNMSDNYYLAKNKWEH